MKTLKLNVLHHRVEAVGRFTFGKIVGIAVFLTDLPMFGHSAGDAMGVSRPIDGYLLPCLRLRRIHPTLVSRAEGQGRAGIPSATVPFPLEGDV